MKHIASIFPLILFLAYLLLFPQHAFLSAKKGLLLWFHSLMPSLLPFMILSNLLIGTNCLNPILRKTRRFWERIFALSPDGAYALLLGAICGYPMGAKVTADLYQKRRISRQEASYLLTFANHPGPAFLSSYLCTEQFHQPQLFLPSLGILYASSFLCCLITRRWYPPFSTSFENFRHKKEISALPSFGELLDISIMNGFEAITRLGGYLILFSILQDILKRSLANTLTARYLIPSLMEITTGITELVHSPWTFPLVYPLSLSFTVLGGLCVAAQTKSMLCHTNLSLKPYLIGKLLCSVCTFLISCCLVKIIKIVV